MNWNVGLGLSEWVWEALVNALMHSIWQAGIAAVLVVIVLRGIATRHAGARALACGVAQLLVLLSFLVTWAFLSVPDRSQEAQASVSAHISAISSSPEEEVGVSAQPVMDLRSTNQISEAAPIDTTIETKQAAVKAGPPEWFRWVGWGWVIGVTVMLLRMIGDLGVGASAARTGRVGDAALLEAVGSVAERMGVSRPFRVVISDRVSGPAVFGVLRPILLLPALPLGLPPEQLEAVLAHELAHIKRHDWVWHIVSRVVEAVLFFNPAVWWLGKMARREREAAADALAVQVTRAPDVLARALVAWGERTQQVPRASVAWRGEEGGLRERVMRIVRPEYRPGVRFSPVGLCAALGVALVMSAGVWRGAEQAVVVAQEILSPAERISRIEDAAQTIAKQSAKTAVIKSITWTGRVRTSDGVPLAETGPSGSGVVATVQKSKSGTGGYIGTGDDSGIFSRLIYGETRSITLTAHWPKYAPTVIGPLEVAEIPDWSDWDIVLEHGFDGRIELVDEQGKRISKATISARLSSPANSQPQVPTETNEGVYVLPHSATWPYDILVQAEGFARKRFEKITLKADETTRLTLAATPPCDGRVIGPDGSPISGAPIHLVQEGTDRIVPGPTLTTTDAEGKFSLRSLNEEVLTLVGVDLEGYGMGLASVKPGSRDVFIQLGEKRILRGEVIGDLTALKNKHQSNGPPEYHLNMTIHYSSEIPGLPKEKAYGVSGWSEPVRIVPDPSSGDPPQRGTFEIDHLYQMNSLPRGWIALQAGEAPFEVQPFDGVKEVRFDLSKPGGSELPQREVILRFKPPHETDPPAKGRVWVYTRWPGPGRSSGLWDQEIPLEEGSIRFSAPIGSRVTLIPRGLIGYAIAREELMEGPERDFLVAGYRIPEGKGALERDFPVVPAGAVRARVDVSEAGRNVQGELGQVECLRVPSNPGWGMESVGKAQLAGGTEGLVTPVALGGVYQLRLGLGPATYFSSESFRVTPENSIPEVKIVVPRLADAVVRVIDVDGNPSEKAEVSISRTYPRLMTSTSIATDANGVATFENLEAGALGEYEVKVINSKSEPKSEVKRLGRKETVLRVK